MEGMCKETAPLPSKCGFPGDFLADVRPCMGKNVGLEPKGLSPSKKGPGFKISLAPLGDGGVWVLVEQCQWSPVAGRRCRAPESSWSRDTAIPCPSSGLPEPGDTSSTCPDCASTL